MVPVGGGIVRLVPAACDDNTAEQTAAGGSRALGVCVRKRSVKKQFSYKCLPEISSVSPPFFRTKTRLAKEKYEMISNVQKGMSFFSEKGKRIQKGKSRPLESAYL